MPLNFSDIKQSLKFIKNTRFQLCPNRSNIRKNTPPLLLPLCVLLPFTTRVRRRRLQRRRRTSTPPPPSRTPLLPPSPTNQMDLETENRIAAILMKEAAELRRQAARDGIDAYLHPPNVRGRPNSRFLTATVLGVQQANRAVEVNEMWRARQKEKEMDEKKRTNNGIHESQKNTSVRFDDYERKHSSLCSSSKSPSEDGLKDKEIEEFLHSRAKRGRGAVGSRMDETGTYLPEESKGKDLISHNDDIGYDEWWDNHAVLGPKKPHNLRAKSSSDDDCSERREKRVKRDCSRKHRSKDKSRDKKKKREKKRSKHHK